MKPGIAIADLRMQHDGSSSHLAKRLDQRGFQAAVCPHRDPRQRLRWLMDLKSESTTLCIVMADQPHDALAALQALEPGIPSIVWLTAPAQSSESARALANSTALISVAESAEVLCQTIALLLLRTISPGQTNETPAEIPAAPSPPDNSPPFAPPPSADPEDLTTLRELERLMSVAKSKPVQHHHREPVAIQRPALDFSIPLRTLMSSARALAFASGATEVRGDHAACALISENGHYAKALESAGLSASFAADYIAPAQDISGGTEDVVVSDEVFDAVARAKEIARTVHAPTVRVYDFLLALFETPLPSIAQLAVAAKTTAEQALDAIITAGPEKEAAPNPFFQPSSLDQAGFYEFDENKVHDIHSRLKELPAFQKAAERVVEKRKDAQTSPQTTPSPQSAPSPATAAVAIAPDAPEKPEVLRVNGNFPSVDAVEQAADFLLEGFLIAFPSDTMLALAADATNPAAVQSLRAAAALPPDKPLAIMINSTAQLKHLVRTDLDELEPLLESTWPGSLTLVFEAAGGVGSQIKHGNTVAVRQPADNISLAILSMLGRPLAVTSWNHDTARLNGKVAAVLTSDQPPPETRTTVVDISTTPWKVLREGAVPAADILQHQPRN